MKYFFLLFFLLVDQYTLSQVVTLGLNKSDNEKIGNFPYEMSHRLTDKLPTIDFSDCSKWTITMTNGKATLFRSQEQRISSHSFSGKLRYIVDSDKEAVIDMRLRNPLDVKQIWNSLDVWTWGDCWGGNNMTNDKRVSFYSIFIRNDNSESLIPFPVINYQYWFLSHALFKPFQYKRFAGFKFFISSATPGKENVLYLNNINFYQESQNRIVCKSFPTNLPFPLHSTTILPPSKKRVSSHLYKDSNGILFLHKGNNYQLSYKIDGNDLLNGNIEVALNNRLIQTITNRKVTFVNGVSAKDIVLKGTKTMNDTLYASYLVNKNGRRFPIMLKYTLKNQSLIVCIEQSSGEGIVRSVDFGTLKSNTILHQLCIPFMTYSYRASNTQRPWLFYNDKLFSLVVPDWYQTNASQFIGGMESNGTFRLGHSEYFPKTDGTLNRMKERIFYNVSQKVEDVLPAIDNPASLYGSTQSDRISITAYGADLKYMLQRIKALAKMGVTKADVRFHEDTWREGGGSFTLRTAPNPRLTVDSLRNFLYNIKQLGWNAALYTNYSDFAPVSAIWNPDWVCQKSDGNWLTAWMRCYALKPQMAWEQEAKFAPQIKKMYNPNFSYCDVMTAVSPNERLDYDSRIPKAGMMRSTYERYAMLLMNERKCYNGPVYSEGGTHWWYAGLVDGNYGNDRVLDLPVFPDFNLLRIHPLEMDIGYMGSSNQYLAYTLAYGMKCFFNLTDDNKEVIRRYAMLQPLQKNYVMIPVSSILYYSKGKYYDTSNAIKCNLLTAPHLKVSYKSGLSIYVNFSKEIWSVKIGTKTYILPQYGFIAYNEKMGLQSSSTLIDNSTRCDEVCSDNLFYLNTNGKDVKGKLGGNGCYIVYKKDKYWNIIPIQAQSHITLDLSLLGLERCKLHFYDRNEREINNTLIYSKIDLKLAPDICKLQISGM